MSQNGPQQVPQDDQIEQRWQALQERCIAMTGKTMPDLDAEETMRVVNLLSTDDRSFALNYLRQFCTAAKPRRRKRQPTEERTTLVQAFELGDDKDDERAVRAAALLLDWASEVGNTKVDGMLVMGVSRVLHLAADRVAKMARRLPKEE